MGEEIEVFPDAHVVVDAERVGHVADHASDGVGLRPDVEPVDARLSGRWLEQRREHAHRRGLARAVRTDEPEDLPLADIQVYPGDGERLPVALGQAANLDRCRHSTVPSRRGLKVKEAYSFGSLATNRTLKAPLPST